ncbi:MAG: phosphatidate cytidylyltransferase [Trueperella sp.]|nr:phosphatidate cytidylyltransferase [Trueperella sp.]
MKSAFQKVASALRPRPPRQPHEVSSKAGRNLPAAIVTAIALLSLVPLSVVVHIEIFVVLVAIFLSIGLWEFAGALLVKEIKIALIPLVVGVWVMVAVTWVYGLGAGMIAYLLTCGISLIWRTFSARHAFTDGLVGCFGLGWIGLFGLFAVRIAALENAPLMVASFVLLPVANDTFGWLVGIFFGKTPIMPKISPKKSWEGFAGSMAGTLVVAIVLLHFVAGFNWYWAVLVGIVAPVFATAGDFAESLMKRDLGVKDMGSIFPGHGGMLDRIDSMLFFAPVCYSIFALATGVL